MKKIALILFSLFSICAVAQETAPIYVSKRVVTRLYSNVFINISRKIFEESTRGNLTLYKDELLTKPMTKQEFVKLGQYKEKIAVEIIKDGKAMAADSFYYVNSTFEWIWGFRKLSNSHFALYIQKPKEASKGTGELAGYINRMDLKNLLGEFEWKLVNDITENGVIGDKQHLADNYWKRFKSFRAQLWKSMVEGKAAPFQAPDLKKRGNIEELKTAFQITNMVTVIQDTAHREYDYQKAEYAPFEPDSILGFGIATGLVSDINTATQTVKLLAVAPLFDPTYSGGDAYFLDAMYWIAYNDALKFLKPEDSLFISEIMYLTVAEKLNTDCVY